LGTNFDELLDKGEKLWILLLRMIEYMTHSSGYVK
jgi:hypothetical protein